MKYKIGIFGSSAGDLEKIIPKAHQLGETLGKENVILITGACDGLPYEVVFTAHKSGTEVWGYSQASDLATQKQFVPHDPSMYTKLIYVPRDFIFLSNRKVSQKYRNVTSTANCDAGIIISGRWGSLNEFTNLHDMGKVIGVLTGTGGIADELPELMKKINKESKATVIFNSNPETLVKQILAELAKRS